MVTLDDGTRCSALVPTVSHGSAKYRPDEPVQKTLPLEFGAATARIEPVPPVTHVA